MNVKQEVNEFKSISFTHTHSSRNSSYTSQDSTAINRKNILQEYKSDWRQSPALPDCPPNEGKPVTSSLPDGECELRPWTTLPRTEAGRNAQLSDPSRALYFANSGGAVTVLCSREPKDSHKTTVQLTDRLNCTTFKLLPPSVLVLTYIRRIKTNSSLLPKLLNDELWCSKTWEQQILEKRLSWTISIPIFENEGVPSTYCGS